MEYKYTFTISIKYKYFTKSIKGIETCCITKINMYLNQPTFNKKKYKMI